MPFEQVKIGDELFYCERLTASLQTASPDKVNAISGGGNMEDILRVLADQTMGAGIARTPDAAFLQGVYVSTGFNRNDDIFLPTELARAYGTIRMKPLDVDHVIEERESLVDALGNNPALTFKVGTNTIIGVIYDVALVHNSDNMIIPASDATSKLGAVWGDLQAADQDFIKNPDEHFAKNRYDVVMAGMMWKWLFPKTTADVIQEISAGHRALSMEVYFRDYDWYVGGRIYTKEEAPHLESAFRKGGLGGQRVGRVLRGMLFGGGGLVRNPANPAAFDYIEVASLKPGSAVFVSSASLQKIEEASKADVNTTNQSSVSDVGTGSNEDSEDTQGGSLMDLKELTATIDKAVQDLAQARAETIVAKNEIEQLKAEVASLKQSLEASNSAKAELETKLGESVAKVTTLTTELESAKAEVATATAAVKAETDKTSAQTQRAEAAETKIKVYEQADVMAKRVASLEQSGVLVDKDTDAQKTAAMSQEEFDAFVAERVKLRDAFAAKTGDDKNKEPGKSTAGQDTKEPVTMFPVFDSNQPMNRTLASLVASDPNAQKTLDKYANL